jgi:hypothetical protein
MLLSLFYRGSIEVIDDRSWMHECIEIHLKDGGGWIIVMGLEFY